MRLPTYPIGQVQELLEHMLCAGRALAAGGFDPSRIEDLADVDRAAIALRADQHLQRWHMDHRLCEPWPNDAREVWRRKRLQAAALAYALPECGIECPHPAPLCCTLVSFGGVPMIATRYPHNPEDCLVCRAAEAMTPPPGWEWPWP